MTRQFWYDRIHRLCKEHLVSPPEEELEEYTIAELEQWTMRRIWTRCAVHTKFQLRRQDVDTSYMAECDTRLIPGGRWLLIFGEDEPVCFFDLDSKDLKQHILIDPYEVDPRGNKYIYAARKHAWMDHKAPRLSLRIAVTFRDKEDGLWFSWVYICQVDLVGHGASATLVAKVIATFRCLGRARTHYSPALNTRHFVQMQYPSSRDTVNIRILDYSHALGCLDYPWINSHTFPIERGISLELINDNILLVLSRQSLSFYTFNVESPTSIKPLHILNLSPTPLYFSRTAWTPEASVITFTQQRSGDHPRIHGLVIPHDSKLRPWMVEVGGTWIDSNYPKPGIYNSLICDAKRGLHVRIPHKWDITSPDSGMSLLGELQQRIDVGEYLRHFDEDTG